MALKFAHINLISTDWRSLAEFYEKVFGCTRLDVEIDLGGEWLTRGTGVPDAVLEGTRLGLPGSPQLTIDIMQYRSTQADPSTCSADQKGLRHIAFEFDSVDELKQCYERVLSSGGSTLGEITSRRIEDLGEVTFVYTLDPEGNIVELIHWH